MLYFVSEENDLTRVKVGYAADAFVRVRQLQTGNPRNLIVLDVVQGDKQDERLLHARLKRLGKHVSGEWFVYDQEVHAILVSYASGSLYKSIQTERAIRATISIVEDFQRAMRPLFRAIFKRRRRQW